MKSCEFQNLETRRLFAIVLTPAGLTALGDFNGDHKADEVVVQRGSLLANTTVTIGTGTGNGLFLESGAATIRSFTATAVAVGDVNGDGNEDVVIVGTPTSVVTPLASGNIISTRTEVIVLLGNGKGGFLNSSSATGMPMQTVYSLPTLLSTSSVAVGDFDGDRYADIAVLGTTVSTAVTTNAKTAVLPVSQTAIEVLWDVAKPSASPVASNTTITPTGNPNVNELFAGDLDGDGKTDLVAALSAQAILPPVKLSVGGNITTTPVRPDLVTVRFPAARTPVVSVGTNPLDSAATPVSSSIAGVGEKTIGLAALSKGGHLDLIGLRGSTVVYSAFNPTSESFGTGQMAQSINAPTNLSTASVYVGDIDGDGLPDLLADTSTGTYFGRNTPSTVANSVLFSWTRVALPPTNTTPTVIARG
ncbi:MAG TPA: VCBS repeat-containing protein [Tepidisphaeraceae bacterium]|jgi:hypothetical protein